MRFSAGARPWRPAALLARAAGTYALARRLPAAWPRAGRAPRRACAWPVATHYARASRCGTPEW